MDETKSRVKVINIILIESEFKRITNLRLDKMEKFTINIQVGVGIEKESKRFFSEVTLKAIQKYESVTQVQAKVKMVGLFEHDGLSEEEQQSFAKINGAAIVFPFIREHLASLTTKAGISTLIINPVNFVELAQDVSLTEK